MRVFITETTSLLGSCLLEHLQVSQFHCRLLQNVNFTHTVMTLSLSQEHGNHEVVGTSSFADVILVPELFGKEATIAPLIADLLKVIVSACLTTHVHSVKSLHRCYVL